MNGVYIPKVRVQIKTKYQNVIGNNLISSKVGYFSS